MLKYSINIVWNEDDKGFIATVLELNGLSAFGKTYEDVLREIKIAAENFIETLKEEYIPIPDYGKTASD